MRTILFLAWFQILSPAQETALRNHLTAYWDSLQKQDRNSALESATQATRNHFLLRREPLFRAWKLLSIEAVALDRAQVTVQIDRWMEGIQRFHAATVQEKWVLKQNRWQVMVQPPADFSSTMRRSQPPPKRPLPSTLQVLPSLVKIHFLDGPQMGRLVIANGTSSAARLLSLDYDRDRFKVLQQPDQVAPQQSALVLLHYQGEETQKELTSQISLVLEGDYK